MMQFRTEINVDPAEIKISYEDKIITIGSCFAENIAQYFKQGRFHVLENPFGVLYNPASIHNSIKLLVEKKTFTENDLIFDQGEYHSFSHHSCFSHHQPEEVLKKINDGLNITGKYIRQADWLIITFGTAYVYEHIERKMIVSNCHKIPQNKFLRYRLSVDEINNYLAKIIDLLHEINPKLQVIFTVSPVRHLKDGSINNQLSKASLLLAVNKMINNRSAFYFPSYEIMMDDLRDYRFYERDLIHPNKIATEYIWQKFSECWFSENTMELMKEVSKITAAREHRPRNPNSPKHKEFLKSLLEKISLLEKTNPEINLTDDKLYFSNIL
ncbi:MAG: GSCFA domain-containing protein [Melioribacteraceae bacterium]|nr:GSCFA domain-containing protein [Melioribacteraceae bacterium]MCF8393340.1 GSCFA domain-containing protein [Melioribacteraceae bacterium]MCF8418905.1 GSCFA domain-containing protein [Melioribacteraceae bacterium]